MDKTSTDQILDEHWAVAFDKSNGSDYVLRLRTDLSWIRRQYLRWVRKTPVQDLYESLRTWLATEQGAPVPDGMDRIDLETSEVVERWVPRCYWLKHACRGDSSSLQL